jgi:hypothetical protein
MTGSIGPLLPADEGFNHQIVETFATVLQTDLAWTEKVCGMAGARDGSLQVAFGFGKYTNRNVVDAYAGISRGVEQWTVRASRSLSSDPDSISVGPIHYEIVEPLKVIHVWLEVNDVQPIAFDMVFKGVVPPYLEEREDRRDSHGFRRNADQIRYHQTGLARGWVEVLGNRIDIDMNTWVATRDHSWGIRQDVGAPLTDVEPMDPMDVVPKVLAIWNPILFQKADGSHYAMHQYHLEFHGSGFSHEVFQGHFEYPDGHRDRIIRLEPVLHFGTDNKRFLGGKFVFTMGDESERHVTARPISNTGFHLGTGLYHGGLDGKYHGSWRGELHLDGEYFENCANPDVVQRIHQFRDCMIRVEDPTGGGIGWGNCQTYVKGDWPDFGLRVGDSS